MLDKMNRREKLMVGSTAAVLAIILLWVGVYEPAVERKDTLQRKIAVKKNELVEVAMLAQKHREDRRRFDLFEMKLKSQKPGVSHLAFMENIAAGTGLKDNIVSMTPQPQAQVEGYTETPVALKLSKAPLPKLLAFLQAVNNAPSYLMVKRISIKPEYENPEWLNVSMTIAGYEISK